MAFPAIPTSFSAIARDAVFEALGIDPGLAISATITNEHISLEFIATDENGDLIRNAGNQYVHHFTVPVQ